MKRLIKVFALFLTLSLISGVMAKNITVETAVLKANNALFSELEKRKAELGTKPEVLQEIVENQVASFIDFEAMAKLTLGKQWKVATKEQRTRFVNAYRTVLINSYAKKMAVYAGAIMTVTSSMSGGHRGYETVQTLITPKIGNTVTANYDVRNKSGRWKAYNMDILGSNLTAKFNKTFTSEISRTSLNALISRLEKDNDS